MLDSTINVLSNQQAALERAKKQAMECRDAPLATNAWDKMFEEVIAATDAFFGQSRGPMCQSSSRPRR